MPSEVITRVEQYREIVDKQRKLSTILNVYIEQQNWEEVTRHVKIINGLSNMIRQDAEEILAEHEGVLDSVPRAALQS